MSGGYMFHPNSTHAYRERTANTSAAGVARHAWSCVRCGERQSTVAGRNKSKTCSGWICAKCNEERGKL